MAMNGARAVEAIFADFKGRRAGLIRALTIDADKFFLLCDPKKGELCLFGLPSKEWELKLPSELVPPARPEPALGINYARDLMNTQDWFSLIAIHSDAWLLAVASYYAATKTTDKSVRKELFNKINRLPTVFEVFKDYMKTVQKGKSRVVNSRYKTGSCSKSDTEENALCGACGEINGDEFWIFCDVCKKWFHGQCVKITPAKADAIRVYRCPSCNKKRTHA